MNKNREIIRKCCSCRESKNRTELIKITLDSKTDEIVVEPNSKIFGRSVYVCREKACIDNFLKKKLLFKGLKISQNKVKNDEYEKIGTVLKNMLVLKIY